MGLNKRYESRYDAGYEARAAAAAERAPVSPFARPPIRVGESTWVLMRDHPSEPAARVTIVRGLGYRRETFYLVHRWSIDPAGRELLGFYPTLADADAAVE